jgi:hypothetical protein
MLPQPYEASICFGTMKALVTVLALYALTSIRCLSERANRPELLPEDFQSTVIFASSDVSIVLSSPTNRAVFLMGDDVPVRAAVMGEVQRVDRVDFFAQGAVFGETRIGSATNFPYEILWKSTNFPYQIGVVPTDY